MELTVLCSSCNTPLLTTAPERLGWPLHGNMFSMLLPNWTLRDMPLYLEYYCPVCQNFPFYSDGSERGHRGVGRYLNILVDGRPKMMSVEQIKESTSGCSSGSRAPALGAGGQGSEALHPDQGKEIRLPLNYGPPTASVDEFCQKLDEMAQKIIKTMEFPCPSCGSKKRFHKRGCSVKEAPDPFVKQYGKSLSEMVINAADKTKVYSPEDPFIETLERRVKKGGFNEDANLPPTPEEIADLARDREARSNGRTEPQLRAME